MQTSLNSNYDVSTFKGQNTNFSFGVDYAKDRNWHLVGGAIYRQADTEGDSVEVGTSLTNRFRLEQTFIGASAGFKYHLSRSERVSISGNVEYSHGQTIKLKVLSGPPISSTNLGKPLYVIMTVGAAYDLPLRDRYSLQFEGRAGLVATTNPQSIIGEGIVAIRRAY